MLRQMKYHFAAKIARNPTNHIHNIFYWCFLAVLRLLLMLTFWLIFVLLWASLYSGQTAYTAILTITQQHTFLQHSNWTFC